MKSKSLILNTNNQKLDSSTKEEVKVILHFNVYNIDFIIVHYVYLYNVFINIFCNFSILVDVVY